MYSSFTFQLNKLETCLIEFHICACLWENTGTKKNIEYYVQNATQSITVFVSSDNVNVTRLGICFSFHLLGNTADAENVYVSTTVIHSSGVFLKLSKVVCSVLFPFLEASYVIRINSLF
jgi:hypothetical protein